MTEKLRLGKRIVSRLARTGTCRWRLVALFALWMALPQMGVAQAPEKWQRLPMVTQALKDYFAARAGNPQFPEAGNFLGGEGGQWPQGWAISGDGNVLLWGTDVGGIARSRDGGATWEPANFGFNARGGVAFAIDPRNPDRAIAIGGNGGRDWVGAHGIYVTSNLKSDMPQWTQKRAVNVVGYRDIREQVDYDRSSYDPAAGYCKTAYWSRGYFDWHDASAKHNAVYKTTDGGETWAELHLDVAAYNLGILRTHPTQGFVYLANANGFYKSTDGAATFTKKFSTPVTGLDVLASAGHENKVFLSTADGVYVSADAGETFTKVSATNYPTTTGTFMPASHLKVSPANPARMMLQIQVDTWTTFKYYSHNGGATWAKTGENTGDLNYLPFNGGRVGHGLWHPSDPDRAWAFGSDGMQISTDGAATLRWSHNGLPAVMGREFNFSTTTPGVFAIPTQDYDVSVTRDNGKTWKYLNLSKHGWGGYFYGAYSSNGDVVFAIEKDWQDFSKYYISITWDNGANTTKFPNQLVTGFHSAFGDPHDSKIFFAGEYRSTDEGRTWTRMNGCDGVFTASPTGGRELYGATKDRSIVRSTDRGATWVPVGSVPNDVMDVAFDPLRNRVYVATQWNLYQLDVATKAVTDIAGRVTADQYGNRRFYQVAVDPVDPNVVYTAGANHIYANDAAVRRSTDGGQTWIPLTRSPRHNNPQFGVDGGKEGEIIRVNPLTRDLVVGTNCYGTWLFGPPTTAPGNGPDLVVTNITWTPAAPKGGETVTFTATVKNNGTAATAPTEGFNVKFSVAGEDILSAAHSGSLAAGQTAQLTGTWTARAGSQPVTALVDPDNGVAETNETNNTQGATVIVASAEPPAAPAGLTVITKSMNTVTIGWNPVADATGYRVFLDGQYVHFGPATTYTFSNLVRYTEYTLGVTAVDGTGTQSAVSTLKVFTDARAVANSVPKINGALTLDGDLNEAAWKLPFALNKTLDGANNNTTTFGMLWDDDNVYIGVKVLDDALHNGLPDVRQNDGVQIYINGNRSSDTSAEQWYWYNDLVAGKVMGNDSTLYDIWNWNGNRMNLDDVTHRTKIIPGGYTVEFAIPWGRGDQYRGIGWESGSVGKKLGVDVWNLDNDNGSGRRSVQVWNGNWDNEWKGQYLGDVTLSGLGGDTLAPSVPADLAGTAGATQVTLSWTASGDDTKVAEYFLYQDGGRIAEISASGAATQTYTVTGLAQNTSYAYTLKAVDEAGNVSDFTPAVTVKTLLDNVAPTAPANLRLTDANPTNVTLAWDAATDNFGVTGYVVYRGATEVGSTPGTSFRVTGLSPLTALQFTVQARDQVGNASGASNVLSVTTPDHRQVRAAFNTGAIRVDGTLNEAAWAGRITQRVTQNLEGTTNNEITFGTAWDATRLYVAVKVLDGQVHANPGQFWSTDALEVYVDANGSRGTSYDADDRQFTRVIFDGGSYGTGGTAQLGVVHAWDTIPGGYQLEMSIPWTNLGVTPQAGMTLGFDLGNNDDDDGGGRDGVLMWNGTGENWRNASAFGRLVLGAIPVTNAAVVPVLHCVAKNGDGTFTARFGYVNDNTEAVTIPVGEANKFTPGPNRGQVTAFQPGKVDNAFTVVFNGKDLAWSLKGPDGQTRTVTATRRTTACGGAKPRAREAGPEVPADGAVVQVYPNPAGESFTVTYQAAAAGRVRLELVDALSQPRDGQAFSVQAGRNHLYFRVRTAPSGVYSVRLTAEDGTVAVRKVVIRR